MSSRASRSALFSSIAALLLAATGVNASAACRVLTPPEGWSASAVQWEGACIGDNADGLGVLKELQSGVVKRSFLGRASKGELLLGVLDETGKPWVAGHFDKGRLLQTDERWPAISAFEEAAKAATEAAGRLDSAGDKPGAQALREKSDLLRKQMD